ncbi:MAG: cation diffusion facilitator family transporter, partial [Planctomycetota bacterium]
MHLEVTTPAAADSDQGLDPRRKIIVISLLMSVVMLVGKLTAYFVTHSAAIFSDAAESVVHGVATGLAAFSLWYAARPADRNHPYGHGRIAYFSAGFEGALVLAASFAVLYSGFGALVGEPELRHLEFGLGISLLLALINLVLGLALIRTGKKHHSLILVANGKHVLSDMWTTIAAILGVGLVMATGIQMLDAAAALLIGGWIMFSGISLIRESFSGLMDEVEPGLWKHLVNHLNEGVAKGRIVDFHHLRCRQVNDETWVDVHMLVPGDLSVTEAHSRVTEVEEAIVNSFAGRKMWITTHI